MRRSASKTLTTASLIGTVVIATAGAGLEATWTFLPGGTIKATSTENIVATVAITGTFASCDTSKATTTAKTGSGLSSERLVSIDDISFTDSSTADGRCPTGTGTVSKVTPLGLPWRFNAQSYDAATGKTLGKVTDAGVRVEAGDGCAVTFAGPDGSPGEVDLSYANSTGEIRIESGGRHGTNLIAVETSNCSPSDVAKGDLLELEGAFVADPLQRVTSP